MKSLDTAKLEFQQRRLEETLRRAEGAGVRGDFDGSVAGSWNRLDDGGAGVATYKGRVPSANYWVYINPQGNDC